MGSLLLGDYDLLDFAGSPARLGTGADLGSPLTEVQAVAKLLLDGDTVSGGRFGNRTITLPVLVTGASVGEVARVVNDLALTVTQPSWQMPWVPTLDDPTVVFDCFYGNLSEQWDRIGRERDEAACVAPHWAQLTLTFAALPFTRDQSPTVQEGAPPSEPIVIDAEADPAAPRTTSGPWENPYNEWRGLSSGGAVIGPAYGGDTIPAVVRSDSTTYVNGDSSILIRCPISPVVTYSSSGARSESDYAPFTLASALAAPLDLSEAHRVEFYTRTSFQQRTTAAGLLRPSAVGIPPTEADADAALPSIHPGTWVLVLYDSTGASSTWVVYDRIDSNWQLVSVDLSQDFLCADDAFDIADVAAYRLRLYAVGVYAVGGLLATPELYDTGTLPGDPVDRHNMALGPAGAMPWSAAAVHVFAAGDADGAWPTAVPVTAGAVYSGRIAIRQPDFQAHVILTMAAGIEWLDAGGASLGIDWGPATVANHFKRAVGQPSNVPVVDFYLCEPLCENVVAPVGTVTARTRFKVFGSNGSGEQLAVSAARLTPGDTAWRYPYADVAAANLWVDTLVAVTPASGIYMESAYSLIHLPAVDGVARTPLSLALAAGDTVHRLLVARTPAPPPGFTPFLDAPAFALPGAGPTADAAALTGQRWLLSDGTDYTLRYDNPARAYGGTYALLVRASRTGDASARIKASANLTGDADALSACQRTWDNEGADLTAFPIGLWRLLPVGVLTLPPRGVDGANSAAVLQINVTGSISAGQLRMDMAVLVDLAGESIMLDMGGGSAQYFWLDAPEQAAAAGTVMGGLEADRSDAVSLAPYQFGQVVLQLDAACDNALTVVLDRSDTTSTGQVSYYSRWRGARPS